MSFCVKIVYLLYIRKYKNVLIQPSYCVDSAQNPSYFPLILSCFTYDDFTRTE